MKIYLACPYTATHYYTLEYRVRIVTNYAGSLIKEGHFVFSPLTHFHPIAVASGLPGDVGFWWEHNRTFMDWADTIYVLCLEGWDTSKGVHMEVEYARKSLKEVKYVCLKANIPEVCDQPEVPHYASNR